MGELDYFTTRWRSQLKNRQEPQYDTQYLQRHFQTSLKGVTFELGTIKNMLDQMAASPYIAAGKDGEDMSEQIMEIKTKVNNIDDTVRRMETDIAVVKTTIDLRFETIQNTLIDIKSGLTSLDKKTSDSFVEIKSDMKAAKNDGVTSKRYWITIAFTGLAVIATWVKILYP